MSDAEFEAVFARVAAGDTEALRTLYSSLGKTMFLYRYSILRDRGLAEDAAQETFLKIWSKAGSVRPGSRPMAWVYTVARHEAISCLRRTGREKPADLSSTEQPSGGRGFDETVEIGAAVDALPKAERQAVVLHLAAGLSFREVGRVTGTPTPTAAWRYARALRQLRAALGEEKEETV